MTKIKKLSLIKKFHSFESFEWINLSTDNNFNNYNLIFGENGSGKSSIVQIFKSLNGFAIDANNETTIQVQCDSLTIDFKQSNWNLLNEKFVFFDSEYVRDYVHVHGKRDADMKKNSGKSFITITPEITQLTSEISVLTDKINTLDNVNHKNLRTQYKNHKLPSEIEEKLKNIKLEDLDKKISSYINFFSDFNNLQNKINFSDKTAEFLKLLNYEPEQVKTTKSFSNEDISKLDLAKQHTISIQNIIEKIKNTTDQSKLDKNDYAELVKNIQNLANITNTSIKLLFLDENNPETIQHKKGIEEFNKVFDQLLNTDILLEFSSKYKDLITFNTENNTNIFTRITDLKNEYKVFFIDWEKLINLGVDNIEKGLSLYKNLLTELKNYKDEIAKIGNLLQSIAQRKAGDEALRKNKIDYQNYEVFRNNEIVIIDLKSKLEKFKDNLKIEVDKFKNSIKTKFNTNLEKLKFEYYLDDLDIPKGNIDLSQDIPVDFQFKHRHNSHKLVIGKMSEGERQLIAFAYFLTELEIGKKYGNTSDKILVFDDPITSLDEGNNYQISYQINLIAKHKIFSQYFVFTHHGLFHKYLAKSKIWHKFGVIKNIIGGISNSFIYEECKIPILEKLKTVRDNLDQIKDTGDIETFAYQYGHLLRLSIEKLVKCYLLAGDKVLLANKTSFDFKEILRNKHGHLLHFFGTEEKLEKLCKIYDFCNWANYLHEDKEGADVLNSLLTCIDEFKQIIDDFEQLYSIPLKL